MKRSSRASYRLASLSTLLGLFSLAGPPSVSAQPAPASPIRDPAGPGAVGAPGPAVPPPPSMSPAGSMGAPPQSFAPQPGYPPPPAQSAYPPPPGQPAYAPPPGQPGYPPPPAQPAYPPLPGQPAYPPPPYATYGSPPPPPPPWQPATPDALHHGFLALPYLGVHSFLGNSGQDLGPGIRLGTLLGGRISPLVSLNAELSLDFLNPQNVPDGVDTTLVDFVIAFSPLLHLPLASGSPLEIVVGPKLGFRGAASSVKSSGNESTVTGSGGVAGLNAGLFGQVSQSMAVGALLSLDVRSFSTVETCNADAGGPKTCTTDDNPGLDRDKTFAFNAALLF